MPDDIPWCCHDDCEQDAVVTVYAVDGGIDDYLDSCADHVEEIKVIVNNGAGTMEYRI